MIEVLQVATKSPVFGYKKMVEGNDADDSLRVTTENTI
jgi:hypothetical protein